MSDRILFLDFDGVINSHEWRRSGGYREVGPFDPQLVDRVNSICETTGAAVVVSSAWRLDRSVGQLRQLLRDHGFTGKVIDKTPVDRANHPQRGDAVLAWLEDRYFDEYVVLDDRDDFDRVPDDRFIRTDYTTGLQQEHVERAIEVLGGERE